MRSEIFLYMNEVLGFTCLAVWIYLIFGRGGFWRSDIRDTTRPVRDVDHWPSVAVIIPARNKSEFIGSSVQSLLRQEYPGPLTINVVDDDSSDDTAAIAARAAAMAPERQLNVITSNGPARGWTGKLWALKEGIAVAEATRPDYLLLTDADIVHAPDTLAWLVAHSMSGEYTLVSLMAKLRCESLAERSHVPAFIYFFEMLFPFAVGQPPQFQRGRRCRRLYPCAQRRARQGRWHRRNSQCADRRLLVADETEGGGTNLAGPDRTRAKRAAVRDLVGRQADDFALRLCATPLFAVVAGGDDNWPVVDIRCAANACDLCNPVCHVTWASPHGLQWRCLLCRRCGFTACRRCGVWLCPAIASLYLYYTLNSAYQYLRRRGGQWKGRVHDAPSLQ